jgi:hypothetical protein
VKYFTCCARIGRASAVLGQPTPLPANGWNSPRHRREYKAALPLVNGFIFIVDLSRLFAFEAVNSDRRRGGQKRFGKRITAG